MTPRVRSLNVGSPREGIRARGERTAIDKRPVASVEVRDPGPKRGGLGSGVVGDDVVSRRHHGGSRQAVYAVAREELDWWGSALGRVLPDGMFGENLTTIGLEVDAAVVGERWTVGSALLEVTAPRIPCATFHAWMGEPGWVRRPRGGPGRRPACSVRSLRTGRGGDEDGHERSDVLRRGRPTDVDHGVRSVLSGRRARRLRGGHRAGSP